jgi:hypothetical protein
MDDEKDIHLSVSRNDKNHLPVRELLQVSRQGKQEKHQQDLLSPKERKINHSIFHYQLLPIHCLINGKITEKMILCK